MTQVEEDRARKLASLYTTSQLEAYHDAIFLARAFCFDEDGALRPGHEAIADEMQFELFCVRLAEVMK